MIDNYRGTLRGDESGSPVLGLAVLTQETVNSFPATLTIHLPVTPLPATLAKGSPGTGGVSIPFARR
jgi:hypothetical protein